MKCPNCDHEYNYTLKKHFSAYFTFRARYECKNCGEVSKLKFSWEYFMVFFLVVLGLNKIFVKWMVEFLYPILENRILVKVIILLVLMSLVTFYDKIIKQRFCKLILV